MSPRRCQKAPRSQYKASWSIAWGQGSANLCCPRCDVHLHLVAILILLRVIGCLGVLPGGDIGNDRSRRHAPRHPPQSYYCPRVLGLRSRAAKRPCGGGADVGGGDDMVTPGREEVEDGLGGHPPRRELDKQLGGGGGADTARGRRERWHFVCCCFYVWCYRGYSQSGVRQSRCALRYNGRGMDYCIAQQNFELRQL